jgi:acyl dehydratase
MSTPAGAPAAPVTRYVEEVHAGDELPAVAFPITVYRLVMEAGANRDFNSIHHNADYARATGAPDMYANTLFLMGMWERCLRDWAGPAARILSLKGFRMGRFNLVGTTTTVTGTVAAVSPASGEVTVTMACSDAGGVTVGPGRMVVRLPHMDPQRHPDRNGDRGNRRS